MSVYYSKSTGGFFDDRIHKTIPGDSVLVSKEDHKELLDKQSSGKSISSDSFGNPVAIDFVPTEDQRKSFLVQKAKEELKKSDVVATRCVKAGVTYPDDWLSRDVILRSIANGEDREIPNTPDYPEGT